MTPQQPLTVTLEAQVWEAVMRAMAKSPYEVVAPLIAEIQRQCMRQQEQLPTNGGATLTEDARE